MKNRLVITSVTAAAAAALLLSGCGQPPRASPRAPAHRRRVRLVHRPASPVRPPRPRRRRPPPGIVRPASATPASAPAGPALCKAANLTASLDATGGGAAGSVYMQLILTNSGAEPCLLKGFAGVSLTAGANGAPIGAAATRDDSTPVADVLLAPGQSGKATLRYTQAGNYPDCTRTPAAGFRDLPAGRHRVAVRRRTQGRLQRIGHQAPDHRGVPSRVVARAPGMPAGSRQPAKDCRCRKA